MSPEQTPSPERITPNKAIEPQAPTRSQPSSDFQSFMQKTDSGPQAAQTNPALSPAAIQQPVGPSGAPTMNSLLSQVNNLQDSLGTVRDQLNEPNLKLKRSQAHLLRNKLGGANEYIQKAAAKVGIESSPPKSSSKAGVLGRLMAYIDDGQGKMGAVQKKLDEMLSSKEQMRPADMMLMQIKMAQAQQEIEYSSVMLSKTVDALKQLFNIQL